MIIKMTDPRLQYTGRIEVAEEGATLCWPGSQIKLRFFGSKLRVAGDNLSFGCPALIGAVVDGEERQYGVGWNAHFELDIVSEELPREHDIVIFKRMEGHYLTVSGIFTDGELRELPPKPHKRIEVYGDSVSAGSVVDAHNYVGKSDPENHGGKWDNSWHAYPQIVARMLPADVYDTSQGGIAIFDSTGWFEMPNTRGMESCYNKLRYSSYHPQKEWNWSFVPHVVIMALGQNDANPDPDVLRRKDSYERWVNKYIEIINDIRSHAPKATVVLALTILGHDRIWDDALDDIAARLGGAEGRAYHFVYTRCGRATPGHPRYAEQCEMAIEMCEFLRGLPETTWED